jgi:signal transduction histidine kinase
LTALSNLISNAVKYSAKEGLIRVKRQMSANKVTVSVSDSGMSIAPDNLPKILERYYRVESSRTQHISGLGIGLCPSAEIISATMSTSGRKVYREKLRRFISACHGRRKLCKPNAPVAV